MINNTYVREQIPVHIYNIKGKSMSEKVIILVKKCLIRNRKSANYIYYREQGRSG